MTDPVNLLPRALEQFNITGIHKAANMLPMMNESEFSLLCDDIKAEGQNNTIKVLKNGLVIDGRNRLCACLVAGIKPKTEVLECEDPLGYVISENLVRRSLTTNQKAVLALEIEEAYSLQINKGRPSKNCPKVDNLPQDAGAKAAEACGVSRSYIQMAKRVKANAPGLIEPIKRGKISVNAAYKKAKEVRQKTDSSKPMVATNVLKTIEIKGVSVQEVGDTGVGVVKSKAEWADWDWNFITGCNQGCHYCPSRATIPSLHRKRSLNPLRGKKSDTGKKIVRVCPNAEIFGPWIPSEWLDALVEQVLSFPEWQFFFLTRFPQRAVEIGQELGSWPENCWIGFTVTSQVEAAKVAAIANSEFLGKKWLALAPLIGHVSFKDLSWAEWILIGPRKELLGTGEDAQPEWCWVENITSQARASGCNIFWEKELAVSPKEMPF